MRPRYSAKGYCEERKTNQTQRPVSPQRTGYEVGRRIRKEFMATPTAGKNGTIVVSALLARAHFGKLLRRVDDERRSLVIEKRGTPKACRSASVNWFNQRDK